MGYTISADRDIVALGRPSAGYAWFPASRSPTTAVLVPRCIHCGVTLSGGDHCGRCAALDTVAQTAADAWEADG
jgi:hypothetical protein